MPLHPKVQALLAAQRLTGAPATHTLSPDQARANMRAQVPLVSGPLADVARVEDREIPGRAGAVPVRLYTPRGAAPFAGIVYFHGGGFVVGDLDTHDPLCRQIAARTGAVVCAVHYRLAPEHPFPAAVEDAESAARWFVEHAASLDVDPARIFTMGDSAGGTLATVTARALTKGGPPALRGQVLIYPITDRTEAGSASYEQFADGYGLTREDMRWFMRHYVADATATDPRVAPLRTPSLHGLPPAFVLTAEYDVLRDEGERYVERLRADGVDVTFERAEGVHHGFIRLFGILEQPALWIDRAAAWVKAR